MTELYDVASLYPEPVDLPQFQENLVEYKKETDDWKFKPVIYESQLDSMRGFWAEGKFKHTEDWIREHFDVVDDTQRRMEQQEAWHKIHEMLDKQTQDRLNMIGIAPQRSGKTWLGSQIEHCIIDEHFRLSEVREVSSLRDLGISLGPLYLDAEGNLQESDPGHSYAVYHREGPTVQLQEWLQLRSVCRRASSCGMA